VESYGADTAMTITRFTHAWTILRNARSTTFLWPFALLRATTLVEDQNVLKSLGTNEQGQDIAEYGVMLALILVLVMGTLRLVGSNANNVFSSVASAVR
jgi:pilus assembly protein Flp/PilA